MVWPAYIELPFDIVKLVLLVLYTFHPPSVMLNSFCHLRNVHRSQPSTALE